MSEHESGQELLEDKIDKTKLELIDKTKLELDVNAKEAKIGSPEAISLNDVVEKYKAESHLDEINRERAKSPQDAKFTDTDFLFAKLNKSQVTRDIDSRMVAIPGYNDAYLRWTNKASELRIAMEQKGESPEAANKEVGYKLAALRGIVVDQQLK